MKIIKITPRGFCIGVVKAWKQILETLKKYPENRVFMLGWFVHNIEMMNEFKNYSNLFLLDDTNISRYDLVNNHQIKRGDVLILSAHGTDLPTIELAKKRGFIIVDTTCEYVYDTHEVIKKALSENKKVLYFGKKNHPEAISSLAISNKVVLVSEVNDFLELKNYFNEPVVICNQTTMSLYDLYDLYDYVKKHFTNYELKNDLCLATTERQEALINLREKIDFLIVVGDQKSNNSNALVKIAKTKGINAVLINSKNEINFDWFNGINCLAITSGASTPTRITNEIIKEIEQWNESKT